jgi:ketosteroid isomerase-like protein
MTAHLVTALAAAASLALAVAEATARRLEPPMTLVPSSPAPAADDLATLTALNQDYITSVQAGDVVRFREILAEDFLASMPDGTLLTKAEFLKQTARPVTIRGLAAHDVQVRLLGDVAIIHARTTYLTSDLKPGAGRYTDIWARRDGRWLAVAAHVTRN